MSLSTTWRRGILPALTGRTVLRRVLFSAFSTTAPALAAPKQGTKGKPQSKPMQRSHSKQKSSKPEGPKKSPYGPGERRLIRNRIILSNTNAPSVELANLTSNTLGSPVPHAQVYGFPDTAVDRLRSLEAFRRDQSWKFFNRPATVVRAESLLVGERMLAVEAGEPTTNRFILDGPGGAGKSVLLLQAMNWAVERGWLVITVPNAQDLANGHTDYDFDSELNRWSQREYCATMLKRIAQGNAKLLLTTNLSQAYKIGRTMEFSDTLSLHRFCELGARDPAVSYEVFKIFFQEIMRPDFAVPVLFALDNFTQLMRPSGYRDTEFKVIHALDLALPALFMEFLRGEQKFARGMVVGATSSAAPKAEEWDIAKLGKKGKWPVYSKLDRARIEGAVKGVDIVPVNGMQPKEGRALLEYCKGSGLMSEVSEITDTVLTERMTKLRGCRGS